MGTPSELVLTCVDISDLSQYSESVYIQQSEGSETSQV